MKIVTTHENPSFDSIAGVFAAALLCGDALAVLPKNLDRPQKNFLSLHFSEKDFVYSDSVDFSAVTEAVLVCVKNGKRLGAAARILDNPNVYITIYDKSPTIKNEIAADCVIEKECGAVTTVVCGRLFEKGVTIPKAHATLFSTGIHEVTGSLLYPNTRTDDIFCLAKLFEAGANLNTIPLFLKDKLSDIQSDLLHKFITSRKVVEINGLDITFFTAENQKFVYKLDNIIQNIVDNEKFNIIFFITKMGNNVHVSARNNLASVNIGDIFTPLGGGGPKYAASVTLLNTTVEWAESKIRSLLKKSITPKLTAADIMTRPVMFLDSLTPARDAGKILFRYGVSGAPVVEGEKVIGYVKKSDVDKAVHHGLPNAHVSGFITRDITYVDRGESIDNLKNLLARNESHPLLVGSESKVAGIITRTDVINYIFNPGLQYRKKKGLKKFTHDKLNRLRPSKNLSNIQVQLEDYFSADAMKFLKNVSKKAAELKVSAYLVGGIVRDIILRKTSLDIDIVIEGMSGIDFASSLVESDDHIASKHDKFKTATIKVPGLPDVDFATARSEFYESPAALPDIYQSNLYQDLLRRDFTINALAVSLNRDNFGLLIDFYGGWEDIQKQRINILHSLSFIEDPTRIFRAIRFKSRLGFRFEKNTEKKLREAVEYGVIEKVEPIRIYNELEMVFAEPSCYAIVCALARYGILEFIHREIVFTERIKSAFKRAASCLEKAGALGPSVRPDRQAFFLSIMLLGVSTDKLPELLSRMHLSRESRDRVVSSVESLLPLETAFAEERKKKRPLSDVAIFELFDGKPLELLLLFYAVAGDESIFDAIAAYVTKISKIKLFINGDTLKSLGLKPGRVYSEILRSVMIEKVSGKISTREEEVASAKRLIENIAGGRREMLIPKSANGRPSRRAGNGNGK